MNRLWMLPRLAAAPVLLLALAGCATSPTGKPQLHLIPESQINQMGAEAYKQARQETPASQNPAINQYVKCVAQHLTVVVHAGYKWQVTVFQKNEANAWALPGGYIGVYTGLLKYARDQAQLAAVLGHEISHVLAKHSEARVSAAYATQAGLQLTQVLLGTRASPTQSQQLMALLGAGAQVGILLPYSRGQESEADILGLQLMARAGFDPREAIQLWQNMQQAGSSPPAFLSDHPSNATRIHDLQAHMPEALNLYRQAQAAGRKPACRAP